MSREQRRADRKARARTSSGASKAPVQPRPASRTAVTPRSRRTPVRAAGGAGVRWVPFAIVGGVAAVILLVAYLIFQRGGGGGLSGADQPEADSSDGIPGIFVPTQGRGHHRNTYSGPDSPETTFCDGVVSSGSAASATPEASTTATGISPAQAPTDTAVPSDTSPSGGTATPVTGCYASNPPSSGEHYGVQRNVDVGGALINIPPDPNVYPSDVQIPRDAIAHIEEHAGVFVGYNCADGDQACQGVVDRLTKIVNDRIDNNDNRVVMANDSDLPAGVIGVASWTRYLQMKSTEFDENLVTRFISVNACRFDPEGFCK